MNAELLLPNDFLAGAIHHVTNAKKRVYLLTMILTDDDTTNLLIDALCTAAERGVAVTVSADTFTYTELGGHFHFNTRRSSKIRHITDMEHRLNACGVKFRWLGTVASSLISGRTHSKWLVVDDYAYTFGGVNLYKNGFENTDYMLRSNNAFLADHLASEQERIIQADRNNHAYRSHEFGDDTNRILIDGGFSGDSIIYRRSCRLVRDAAAVTYVSQYCPTGKLGRLLKKSSSTLYFNQWNHANSLNALAIRVGSMLSGLTTDYKRSNYIHCKCMIFTFADGSKRAITGSHNFSSAGVWLGTREIALETGDPHIIKQLERFIARQIA